MLRFVMSSKQKLFFHLITEQRTPFNYCQDYVTNKLHQVIQVAFSTIYFYIGE